MGGDFLLDRRLGVDSTKQILRNEGCGVTAQRREEQEDAHARRDGRPGQADIANGEEPDGPTNRQSNPNGNPVRPTHGSLLAPDANPW
jgi:hypothetical protein